MQNHASVTPVALVVGGALYATIAPRPLVLGRGVARRVQFRGEKDGVTPAAMRKLNAALPGSRYVEMAGAGHISNMDQPEAFTRAVQDFLKS